MRNNSPRWSSFAVMGFICTAFIIFLQSLSIFICHDSACAETIKEKKRVFILLSAQSDLLAYTMVKQGITSILNAENDFEIEYFIEYMDYYRHPDQIHRQLLTDLFHHKYAKEKIDLIIAYAVPSLEFVLSHRDDLFPHIPIVFSGIPPEKLKGLRLDPDITGILANIDYAGLLETALEIHPGTKHVALVNGASKTDLIIEKEVLTALEPYTRQLDFIYLNRLPLGEIQQRVQTLPKDTVVLFYLLMQDGEGKSFQSWRAASIVAESSNSPVYGCLDSYFGHGLVGGRMISMEMTGIKAAEVALRIFRGEKPSDIIPSQQGTIVNLFDWRQFKRFGIRENRLPPNSIVKFKTYSFWDHYKVYIMAAAVLLLVQSGLISFLLIQRTKRRQTQEKLSRQLRFEEMLSTLSARFINLPPDRVDAEIHNILELIGTGFNVDRVSVLVLSEEGQHLHLTASQDFTDVSPLPAEFRTEHFPWIIHELANGQTLCFSDLAHMPADADSDRKFLESRGIRAFAALPLLMQKKLLGVLTLNILTRPKNWPDEIIQQCQLVTEILANALTRKRHAEKMKWAEAKYRLVADFTYDWEYWLDIDGNLEYISPSCERISGYTTADLTDNPSLFREMIIAEDHGIWDSHYERSRRDLQPHEIQFRIRRQDGQIRWIEHSCQPILNDYGVLQGFRASNRDITTRKLTELNLHRAYTEIEQLKNQLEAETAYLQEEIKLEHNFENIIGTSAALKYVLYKVEQIASTDTTVLILGESGTGKELIARAIHNKSSRQNRTLVKVNCGTLPANLIESELFGHERGAFTGAEQRQLGRFEVAAGTSIFLDEIGELPLEMQTKLLGVLQDREFERLGSSRTIKADVRVIAATNRNLEEEVQKGRFREDLLFRLNVFPITVPPLRERIEDISPLTHFFADNASKRLGKSVNQISAGVLQKLQNYSWPGNIRELENVIERSVINSSGPKLHLADNLTRHTDKTTDLSLKSLQENEKEHILRVLRFTNWRIEGVKGAAQILKMNPSTLRSRIRKHSLKKP